MPRILYLFSFEHCAEYSLRNYGKSIARIYSRAPRRFCGRESAPWKRTWKAGGRAGCHRRALSRARGKPGVCPRPTSGCLSNALPFGRSPVSGIQLWIRNCAHSARVFQLFYWRYTAAAADKYVRRPSARASRKFDPTIEPCRGEGDVRSRENRIAFEGTEVRST